MLRKAEMPMWKRKRVGVMTVGVLSLMAGSCTNAGLIAVGANGPSGPDRGEVKGSVCVPLAAGDSFPVKVLFAVEGGPTIDPQIKGEILDALNATTAQFSTAYISFGVVAFHSIATGLQGSFVRDERLAQAFAKYSAFQETGPVSQRSPLRLAKSLISGDMQTACRGLVARTRYLVVHVMLSPDVSCSNPIFNPGISKDCAVITDQAQCSACELAATTEDLRQLAKTFNAGEVIVQPLVIQSTATLDPLLAAQAYAVATAGGTTMRVASPGNIKDAMTSLNYASLQRALTIKRFVALNSNVVSRRAEVLVDSDADGIPDEEERRIGTDPVLADSDNDGLGDGVELKMGLKPQNLPENVDIIRGCNAGQDLDGDRLNDCEERVLGTDACISDTDGDGLPEMVEFLSGTNPLIAEDLQDDDRDGTPNIREAETHTDSLSADIAFQQERGYGYDIWDEAPTADGRACYGFNIYNVTLGDTLKRPARDGSGIDTPKGTNDIFIYLQVGRENDPRGTGIGALSIPSFRFTPPATKRPRGAITLTPDDFNSGY
jgi:hypothetical protein